MITIPFEISQNGYTLKDAIVLPDDHDLTNEAIELLKQARFDDFYAIVSAPEIEVLDGE
jgi:hypothetical protein